MLKFESNCYNQERIHLDPSMEASFSSAAAAGGSSRRALAGASFGLASLDGRRQRRGSHVGAGTIFPGS